MNLQLGGLLLVAALFTSSSTLTPDECQPLITPLSLTNVSTMYGRWNYLVAYIEMEGFDYFERTQSMWININQSPNPNELIFTQCDRIGGTCITGTVNGTFDADTFSILFGSVSSQFQLLPACDGCMVKIFNTTSRDVQFLRRLNIIKLLKGIDFDPKIKEISFRHLYMMARGSSLQDSDLERFKQQASCLGFSGEPGYHYDPKNEFCAEGEGIKIIT
ncbi:uncharacterized protein LOC131984612 [Centropristis striata]|uniref:uncharacterized protein LOC131984612 n=1 Tax=Centropristis striata TaxID=184440 RepID=UPI0027E13E37|nr:uncharacterized protein LOC131984612 [Centropristis striata]